MTHLYTCPKKKNKQNKQKNKIEEKTNKLFKKQVVATRLDSASSGTTNSHTTQL